MYVRARLSNRNVSLNSGKNSSASYTFKDGGAFKSFTKAFPVLFNDFTLPIYFQSFLVL